MIPSFTAPDVDWFHLAPLLIVLLTGVVGVLIEAFAPERSRRPVQLMASLIAVAAAFVMVLFQWASITEAADRVLVLGGSYTISPTTVLLQLTILLVTFLSLILVADRSSGAEAIAPAVGAVPGSDYEELARRKNLTQTEVYPLILFAAGGMMIFPAAGNLLTMFIALEVLSLPLYVLTGMARYRRLLSQEASLKYFLLGAFASALFLFGITLVYGYTGTIDFKMMPQAGLLREGAEVPGGMWLLFAGLTLMIGGVVFKVGAVPFHQWTPDVYQGAPTPITGFMAAATKVAAFGAVLRLLSVTVVSLPAEQGEHIATLLWVISIATMVVGSVGAIVQHDMKRLLAYSSIAHAGFVLVAVTALSPRGAAATVFYLLAYSLATVGAFAVVQLVRESARGEAGDTVLLGEATHLTQWAGLGKRRPWLAGAFALFLLSFAGVPLTAGFIGKFWAFTAAVDAGYWVLALIGVLASAISVFFYIRIIVLMYFMDPPEEPSTGVSTAGGELEPVAVDDGGTEVGVGLRVAQAPARPTSAVSVLSGSFGIRAVIAVAAVGTLVLGIFPGPVLDLIREAAQVLP